jgi:hypothetical protein
MRRSVKTPFPERQPQIDAIVVFTVARLRERVRLEDDLSRLIHQNLVRPGATCRSTILWSFPYFGRGKQINYAISASLAALRRHRRFSPDTQRHVTQ